ncbi:MAG: glycosyltransferase family 2 protein [Deltaproteobacteria bacterium]|nr:glycosyltransferase family 2 protein [Deltaproteobacteria bacterium]
MVDIIVVTFNAAQKLRRCLASISRYRHPGCSLTVIDNHSTDGTKQFLHSQRDLRVIRTDRNRGFSFAANLGMRVTTSPLIALLDDDVEVTAGWLDKLLEHFKGRNKVGLVSPKIVYPNGTLFSAGFFPRQMIQVGHGERDYGQHDCIREVEAVPGPCWVFRRQLVEQIGGFDEKFRRCQYEDIDFCLRVRKRGFHILNDGRVSIVHHRLFRVGKEIAHNRSLFWKKWKSHLRNPIRQASPLNRRVDRALDAILSSDRSAARHVEKIKVLDPAILGPYFYARAMQCADRPEEARRYYRQCLDWYDRSFLRSRKEHWNRIKRGIA